MLGVGVAFGDFAGGSAESRGIRLVAFKVRKAASGQGPGFVPCSAASVTPSMQRLVVFCVNAAYFQGARLLLSTRNGIAVIFRSLKCVLTLGVPHFNLHEGQTAASVRAMTSCIAFHYDNFLFYKKKKKDLHIRGD